jgi:octaprenyl-diphosphate synthase
LSATQNQTLLPTDCRGHDCGQRCYPPTAHSDVPLVNQIAEYIISAGGKTRPVLVLLIANAYGYQGKTTTTGSNY